MVDGLEARDEEYYLRKYIEELEPLTDLIVLSVHEGVPGRQSTKGLSDVERTLSKDIDLAKCSWCRHYDHRTCSQRNT